MIPEFVLASNSPRRRELLSMLGMEFSVKVSDCDENIGTPMPPHELVRELAKRKALAVADTLDISGTIVIGADTVVCDGERILGKPKSEEEAVQTLLSLSDKAHSVYTGVALVGCGKVITDAVETKVVFDKISEAEAKIYVQSGEPMDKAGSYGIQGIGGFFVKELHGDYYNVVGLPIARLRVLLEAEFGIAAGDYIGKKRT